MLEGWNMRESTVINEWIAEGRTEGRAEGQREAQRADLLRVLRGRFNAPVPDDVTAAIQAASDLDVLGRWLDIAVRADSLDAFRAAIQQ
jgi:hypothetical protein